MIKKISLTEAPWKFLLSKEAPDINGEFNDTVMLPSTVSMTKKSPVTDERSEGCLTDPHKFEGYAVYERTVTVDREEDCEVFFVMERTRTTELYINGVPAGSQNSLCAPHRYSITEFVKGNPIRITVIVNNVSCPVQGGHMTSPDTQTNWLGITGNIYLEYCAKLRAENIRLFPDVQSSAVTVKGHANGRLKLTLKACGCPELSETVEGDFSVICKIDNPRLWSEHDPYVYTMSIAAGSDVTEIDFGMRSFASVGSELILNGEKIFLRGKHDGMIFPLTGAAPTDKESWLRVMGTAKEHGVNHYRFHTCCPPEAAFEAADELGIYMEPELPFWGTVEEELTPGQEYLVQEGFRILDAFGSHPSFFALSLGNELWGSQGRLNAVLGDYKAYDSRHLYTQGSNNFQFWPVCLENDDFFVGVRFSRDRLFRGSYAMCDAPQGHIQTAAPNTNYNYDSIIRPEIKNGGGSGGIQTVEIQYGTGVRSVTVDSNSGELIPKIPVVSHEVGQYFMYPDYGEIEKYTGALKPYNLEIFRQRLENAGLGQLADSYFKSSGKFAAECYKAEIETALRSKELSGFQLLDIQDFTGQGTALVGVLNSFMESKGVISPEKWRQFCSDRVILGCMPKLVFAARETLSLDVMLYSYTGRVEVNPKAVIEFDGRKYIVSSEGEYKNGVFMLGSTELNMPSPGKAEVRTLTLKCGETENSYRLVIFPEVHAKGDFVTDWEAAKKRLRNGENVLFLPDGLPEEKSVEGTYCTDFWNYPMFSSISLSMKKPLPAGTLGLLIDTPHPALSDFPCEEFSAPEWYDAVTNSRSAILDGISVEPIVRTIDNCGRNHSLGFLFEVSTGGGKLLVCTGRLDKKPESISCRYLLKVLEEYAGSDKFSPAAKADIGVMDRVFNQQTPSETEEVPYDAAILS